MTIVPRVFESPHHVCLYAPKGNFYHGFNIKHDRPWWNLWRRRWYAECRFCGELRHVR